MSNILRSILLGALVLSSAQLWATAPTSGLLLNSVEAKGISQQVAELPLLAKSVESMAEGLNAFMSIDMDVPVPRDAGGGYTHERHKKNGQAIYEAATLYQVTSEQRYADFAVALLLRYADLYPKIGPHPKHKHQAPGKLFWQILNDAVWLVYVIQGYDQLQDVLTPEQKELIARNLLNPYVKYLSVDSSETFNKVHNHGTWAAAAVGMTGLVLGNQEYVDIALKGSAKDGRSGFLKQIEALFSPDGYYTEGPYYQRYALMPFVVFARALDRVQPQWDIFKYRDGVLLKAIYACINLSYNNLFFPLNDAIKDKGLDTIELVYGVDIAYALTKDKGLLSVAANQQQVIVSGDGLLVAQAIAAQQQQPFDYSSMLFRDGANGDEGGVAVLRSDDAKSALVVKAAGQGMGHGHFDRLGWLYYDHGNEIVSDYGAARYLNVVTKRGGVYLPENNTWAKQSIAHNTLVVDERSHFNGKLGKASESSAKVSVFSDKLNAVSVVEANAYPGVSFERTMGLIQTALLDSPLVLDLMTIRSSSKHQYDLPLHYAGQLTYISEQPKVALSAMETLGKKHGYQHLWKKGWLPVNGSAAQVTWLKGNRFYSLNTLLPKDSQILFAELGANDPEFNLRRENALVLRQTGRKDTHFVSVLESHGEYNGVREYTKQPTSRVRGLEHHVDKDLSLVLVELDGGARIVVAKADSVDPDQQHTLALKGKRYQWRGHLAIFEESSNDGK